MSEESPDDSSTPLRNRSTRIRAFVETLAEIEEETDGHRRASGHIDRGRTRIEYDYTVAIGFGRDARVASPREQTEDARTQTGQMASQTGETAEESHIESREGTDGELVVIANLSGTTDDEIDVTLEADESALVLTADDETIERIELAQHAMTITDVSRDDQMLEIRLTQVTESNGGDAE